MIGGGGRSSNTKEERVRKEFNRMSFFGWMVMGGSVTDNRG